MSILGLSKVAAYERLRQLTASGRLVRVGTKYYPAGQVVPPEEQYGVIREFFDPVRPGLPPRIWQPCCTSGTASAP